MFKTLIYKTFLMSIFIFIINSLKQYYKKTFSVYNFETLYFYYIKLKKNIHIAKKIAYDTSFP